MPWPVEIGRSWAPPPPIGREIEAEKNLLGDLQKSKLR
jgi:hypothetical protein